MSSGLRRLKGVTGKLEDRPLKGLLHFEAVLFRVFFNNDLWNLEEKLARFQEAREDFMSTVEKSF